MCGLTLRGSSTSLGDSWAGPFPACGASSAEPAARFPPFPERGVVGGVDAAYCLPAPPRPERPAFPDFDLLPLSSDCDLGVGVSLEPPFPAERIPDWPRLPRLPRCGGGLDLPSQSQSLGLGPDDAPSRTSHRSLHSAQEGRPPPDTTPLRHQSGGRHRMS
eukprot:5616246-Alexandrium_andersonii.AAC.1